MLIYFNRHTQFRYLKYTELFKSYIVEKISQVENEDQDDLSGYFLINIPGLETLYLQTRSDRTKPSIIEWRFYMLPQVQNINILCIKKSLL